MVKLFLLIFFLALPRLVQAQVTVTDRGAMPNVNGTDCLPLAESRPCYAIYSYSGPVWDSGNNRFFWWGAGHAASTRDSIFVWSESSPTWTELYTPTACSYQTSGNYDFSKGAWTTGASGSYPRPNARHVLKNIHYSPATNSLILTQPTMLISISECTTFDGQQDIGKISHYNFGTGQWIYTNVTSPVGAISGVNVTSELDPTSGLIVIADGSFLATYDPSTQTYTTRTWVGYPYAKDESNNNVAGDFGSNGEMIYAAVTDSFYSFNRISHRVWKITPNRSNWNLSTITLLNHNGTFPTHSDNEGNSEPGWAYDSVSQQICGAVTTGTLYCFDPVTKTFTPVSLGTNISSFMHGVRYNTTLHKFLVIGHIGGANPPHTYTILASDVAVALGGGGGDVTNPSVAVTTPSSTTTTSATTYTLSGTAGDDTGVTSVTWTNSLGGSGTATCTGCTATSVTWSITNAALTLGDNVFTVTAHDAAGNTASATRTITRTTTLTPEQDFADQCAQVGVVRCFGFETSADRGTKGWGNRIGYDTKDGTVCGGTSGGFVLNCPTLDTEQHAAGSYSLKFVFPPGGDGSDAGQWWANFSDDLSVQFGEGQTFYVQFRQRYDANIIAGGNFKVHWAGTAGDRGACASNLTEDCQTSCTDIEFVAQANYPSWPFPTFYQGCPGRQIPLESTVAGDIAFQNDRPSPYCLYNNGNPLGRTNSCFQFFANEWMTYTYKVQIGARGNGTNHGFTCQNDAPGTNDWCYYGSSLETRMGREGQATEPVVKYTGPINASPPASSPDPLCPHDCDLKYGKLWVSPRTGVLIQNGGTMWIDNVIVSTSPIRDPGAVTAPNPRVNLSRRRTM